MNAKRRTEVTIETHRVLMIRGRRRYEVIWCEACGKQAEMVSADEAAIVACVSARVIYRWVETDRLHFAETAEGLVLVCLNSLGSIGFPEGDIQVE